MTPGSLAATGLVLLLVGYGSSTVHGGRSTGVRGEIAGPVLEAGFAGPASSLGAPRLPGRRSQVPQVPHVPHVGWWRGGAAHDLHETYAELAIEDGVIGGRIRFFKRDLERALGPMLRSDAVSLAPGAEADALVRRYLGEHFTLVAGDTLEATLVRGEEVELGHHPGWQVTVTWEAPTPVGDLHVRNSLLLELHEDQRNIMRIVRFPEAVPETVTFERGAEEKVVAG